MTKQMIKLPLSSTKTLESDNKKSSNEQSRSNQNKNCYYKGISENGKKYMDWLQKLRCGDKIKITIECEKKVRRGRYKKSC